MKNVLMIRQLGPTANSVVDAELRIVYTRVETMVPNCRHNFMLFTFTTIV